MAATLSGSGDNSPLWIWNPKNFIVSRPIWILFAPAFRPRFPSMVSINLAFWAAAAWFPPPVAKSSINAPTSSCSPSSAMALLMTAWK